jgi:hypothetical protein
LSELGLSSDFIIAATQDTTGNSINTFNEVDHVAQLLCCSHTNELVSEHSVKGDIILDNAFSAVKKLMVRAKGNKSSKRRRLLIDKCAEAGISFKSIYLPSPTRWGGNVIMMSCFNYLYQAFSLYTDDDLPLSTDDQTPFTELYYHATKDIALVHACTPILTVIFEWTQILTSANTPTSGLVLLMVNRIKAALEHLLSLSLVPNVDVYLRDNIRTAHESFKRYIDKYYNEDFTGFWIYKVAAFLDPRGFCALSADKWASTVEFIKAMCTDEEILSQFEIHEREQAEARVNQGRVVRRRLSAATPQPQLTVEEQALANILSTSEQYSKVVPVTAEIGKYLPHVQSKIKEGNIIDPLVYYAEHGKDFPILSRIASQVFAAEATSGETERIASDAGIYYSKRRSRLKPETVKKMIFLQGCFLQDMPQRRRAKVANERVQEFIKKQSLSCQINRNGPSEDFIEFLNGLCPWIYYDEDEAESDDDLGEESEGEEEEN